MTAWNYDWTDEHGVAHHYPRLFGWLDEIKVLLRPSLLRAVAS